jgi:hypothetical protein
VKTILRVSGVQKYCGFENRNLKVLLLVLKYVVRACLQFSPFFFSKMCVYPQKVYETLSELFGEDVGNHIFRIFSVMKLQRYWKYRVSLFCKEELKARAHFLNLFTCHVPSLSIRMNWDGAFADKKRRIGHLEVTTACQILDNKPLNVHIPFPRYINIWCAVDYVRRRVYVIEVNDKYFNLI